MFELKETISRNNKTDEDDTAAIKFALTSLGYYDDTETGLSPYADDSLFRSVQIFQKDKKLKIDGVINPDGETQREIKNSLKKDKKAGNAFGDFKRNYEHMKEAKIIGADKYFHCKANYEAAKRGWLGEISANFLSNIKELAFFPIEAKRIGPIDSFKDSLEDEKANLYGRRAVKNDTFQSAEEACEIFRPKGLDEKY